MPTQTTMRKTENNLETGKVYAQKLSVSPKSLNKENRTVEVVWTTGSRVDRGAYAMELSLGNKNVNLTRLKNGAPVLDNHDSSGGLCGPAQGLHGRSLGQIGVVEDAWFEGKGEDRIGVARLRFSSRPEVESIFQDIESGVVRHVSVGFSIEEYEEVDRISNETRDVPVYMATRWTPIEISPVQAGADDAAVIRNLPTTGHNSLSAPSSEQFKTVIETAIDKVGEKFGEHLSQQLSQVELEKRELDNDNPDMDTNINTSENETENEERVMPGKDEKALQNEAVKTERKRVSDIREAVAKAGLERSFADELEKNEVSIEDARTQIIDKLATKSEEERTSSHVEVGKDNKLEHIKRGLQNAWLHRGLQDHKLDEDGKAFAGLSLVRSAEVFVGHATNEDTRFMNPEQIVKRALSTSDFPELLADTMNKSLRSSYNEAPQTFEQFVRRVQVQDFKQISRTNYGDAPSLEEVKEHGAVKLGKISEDAEKYAVKTYAKKLRMTRKMLINDDMDAFVRTPSKFGIASRDLESDLVWGLITGNDVMSDGNGIFHASHNNIGSAGALSDTTIGELEKFMLLQKGLDGRNIIIPAVTIYAPVAMRTQLRKYLTQITPAVNADAKVFLDLGGITEPRLDADSATQFYLFSSASNIDMIELAGLAGQAGPSIETKAMGGIEGIEVEAYYDVGAKAIDYRGFTRNAGA